MKNKFYAQTSTPFLRKPFANALSAIQSQLKKKKLGLLSFDAYRPYAITERMWELIEDERYVANPKNGSGHNRGIYVDLSIINLKNNQPLEMGTDFDNFSDFVSLDRSGNLFFQHHEVCQNECSYSFQHNRNPQCNT